MLIWMMSNVSFLGIRTFPVNYFKEAEAKVVAGESVHRLT